jgi:hypothetical protein
MRSKSTKEPALAVIGFAACAVLCAAARATIAPAQLFPTPQFRVLAPRAGTEAASAPLVLAQNPTMTFTLPQVAEPAVSPINPGTLPGSTAAIGGSATGTNPITGLPCNGAGSLSVSGAGGLVGTATPPPQDSTETLDQIPVGTPPTTSIFGSQNNLGSC